MNRSLGIAIAAGLMGLALGCAVSPWTNSTAPVDPHSVVLVGPAETVLSAEERPYSWPDGTMGLLREADGYRFFAASAGYPISTVGTLENPIAKEVQKLAIVGMKKPFDYVAGGPIYRDPATGILLMFYHAEIYIFPPGYLPFYSEVGLARSLDGGKTWTDLGIIISPHAAPSASFFTIQRRSWDIGWGSYAIVDGYFYLYFADLLEDAGGYQRIHHAVARAPIADVVKAAVKENTVSDWLKYYDRGWREPGVRGKSSPLLSHGDDSFMLGDVSYNTALGKYVAVLIGEPWPNSDLYWAESDDGLQWSNFHKIVDDPGHEIYVTLVGLGDSPRHSGNEFYLYYVHSADFERTGDRNKDGKLLRRLLTVQ